MVKESKATLKMVSRRKILSQSRDELNFRAPHDEEDDTWYNKEKLFKVIFHPVRDVRSSLVSLLVSKKVDISLID